MRVFLDANVLFSAAYRERGPVRTFFALAAAGACTLVSSAHAIEEARRNIALKHPALAGNLETLLGEIESWPEPAAATIAWAAEQGLLSKDAPILAAAVEACCQVLATGDRS